MEINKTTIKEFEKLLIELGGFHELRDNGTIYRVSDGEQIAVPVGKQNLPIVLFEEGMPVGSDVVYLNPFSETMGVNRDREWFYDMLSKVLAGLIKGVVIGVCTTITEKKNAEYTVYPLVQKVLPFVDENFVKEVSKISLNDWFCIFYNKSRKTAEAQCAIFTNEFKAAHPKFRKKTWDGLEQFYLEIFRTTNLEESYSYTSQTTGIPETDAKLNIVIGIVRDIAPYVKDILGVDLQYDKLVEHMANIEGYGKLYSWAVLRRGPVVEESKPVPKSAVANGLLPQVAPAAPFNGAAPANGVQPGQVITSAAFVPPAPVAAPAAPAPTYVANPAYVTAPAPSYVAPTANYGYPPGAVVPVGMPGPAPAPMMAPMMSPMAPAMNVPGSYDPATGFTPGGTMFGGGFGGYR